MLLAIFLDLVAFNPPFLYTKAGFLMLLIGLIVSFFNLVSFLRIENMINDSYSKHVKPVFVNIIILIPSSSALIIEKVLIPEPFSLKIKLSAFPPNIHHIFQGSVVAFIRTPTGNNNKA